MTNVESGIREMLDLVNSQRAELAALRAQLEDFRASQHYRYIGADGKTVLARDLEDERDRFRVENERLRDALIRIMDTDESGPLVYEARHDGIPQVVGNAMGEIGRIAKEALK